MPFVVNINDVSSPFEDSHRQTGTFPAETIANTWNHMEKANNSITLLSLFFFSCNLNNLTYFLSISVSPITVIQMIHIFTLCTYQGESLCSQVPSWQGQNLQVGN